VARRRGDVTLGVYMHVASEDDVRFAAQLDGSGAMDRPQGVFFGLIKWLLIRARKLAERN
jgi:hypothetical protein